MIVQPHRGNEDAGGIVQPHSQVAAEEGNVDPPHDDDAGTREIIAPPCADDEGRIVAPSLHADEGGSIREQSIGSSHVWSDRRCTRSNSRRGIGESSPHLEIKHTNGDTMVKSINGKIVSTVTISEEKQVDSLIGDSVLTICPNYLTDDECCMLSGEVLACAEKGKMRQYGRKGGTFNEPRLHILLGNDGDMGYHYKDVRMAAHNYDMIPGVKPLAHRVAKKLGVDRWRLGVDVIVYGSGNDGIGWHRDNSQGETTVACIILLTTTNPRPLLIKPTAENAGHPSFKLKMHSGTLYHNNGCFQSNYFHRVPKLVKSSGTSSSALGRRIVLVFRDGDEVRTVDNGKAAPLSSRMNLPDTVQYGQINGIEEGQCYPRRALLESYAHRATIKAVNGRIGSGCDSIILSRNNPDLGERDGKLLSSINSNFVSTATHIVLSRFVYI